jgi:hypothetical protein
MSSSKFAGCISGLLLPNRRFGWMCRAINLHGPTRQHQRKYETKHDLFRFRQILHSNHYTTDCLTSKPKSCQENSSCQRRGRKEQGLPKPSKGDKSKVALARQLRQETTMSLKRTARRMPMGSWTHISNLLHEKERG